MHFVTVFGHASNKLVEVSARDACMRLSKSIYTALRGCKVNGKVDTLIPIICANKGPGREGFCDHVIRKRIMYRAPFIKRPKSHP
jgi:hypothetical protein